MWCCAGEKTTICFDCGCCLSQIRYNLDIMEIWDAEYEWIHYNTIAIAMPMPMVVAHVAHYLFFFYNLFIKEGETADDTC